MKSDDTFVREPHRAKRPRRLVFVYLLLSLGLIGLIALGIAVMYPRSITLPISDRFIGFYQGLGMADSNDLLGYRFFEFTIDDSPFRNWTVVNEGLEYNKVTGHYPDGTVCMEGKCIIEGRGRNMYPSIDEVSVATSYRPDVTIACKVQHGTGKLQLFYPNGRIQWESILKDYERTSISYWNEKGTLLSVDEN